MKAQTMHPFKVTRTFLNLQDVPINLDDITALKDSSVFVFEPLKNRPYELEDTFVAGISVEMNLDQKTLKRLHYSLLDAFAEIGGLSKLLNTTMTILAYILSYDRIEAFLASRLYKIKPQEPGSKEANEILLPKCHGIVIFLAEVIPKKLLCRCCTKKSRQEIALFRAREKLDDEVNMLDIVR